MAENIDAERATLLPCPFCGGAAELKHTPGSWGYYPAKYGVKCTKCGISTAAFDDDDHPAGYEKAKASAIAAWNRRATPPSPSTAPIAEDERAAFEAWAKQSAIRTDLGAWDAWQARAALASRPAGEVEKHTVASILESIVKDGYLSETNVWRARAALASKPAAQAANAQGVLIVYVNRKELDDANAQGGGLLTCEPKPGRYFDVPLYAAPPLSSEQQANVAPCEMPGCSAVGPASSPVTLCAEHSPEFNEWRKRKAGEQRAEKGQTNVG